MNSPNITHSPTQGNPPDSGTNVWLVSSKDLGYGTVGIFVIGCRGHITRMHQFNTMSSIVEYRLYELVDRIVADCCYLFDESEGDLQAKIIKELNEYST